MQDNVPKLLKFIVSNINNSVRPGIGGCPFAQVGDLCVYLSGSQVGMAKQYLNYPDVCPIVKYGGGKRVAKKMRGNML